MANVLYDLGRESFLRGEISWNTNNIKVSLLNATYVANVATDQFFAIIPGPAVIATSGNLTTKSTTAGVADADDVTYLAVPADTLTQIVIWQDTGVAATSRLIAYLDTITGAPVAIPGGATVVLAWSNLATRIFKL